MTTTILIINGPNLNMLGAREPEIYGHETLDDIKALCTEKAAQLSYEIDFKQSNHEGEIVDWIQAAAQSKTYSGLIINPAAYTHTSVAIHDALKLLDIPVIEVHLSNPATRENFRHHSYITPLASAVIKEKGAQGYAEAITTLEALVKEQ
jgi:3-dehydroquinate dehydratase-2